jgi:hypothetical protein
VEVLDMNAIVRYSAMLLVLAAAIPAFSDDQEKANKEVVKVTAMATDATGRGIVSRALADVMGVKRPELLQQRQAMNLNYGALFVAEELIESGAKPEDLVAQLKSGKTITQVANDMKANWKQIGADGKKLNARIDDGIYKHFVNEKADKQRDLDEKYEVAHDVVPADASVDLPKSDLEAAAERFGMWRDRAAAAHGTHHVMSVAEEQAAYSDHDRAGGPGGSPGGTSANGGNGSEGTPAPAAGGGRMGPN